MVIKLLSKNQKISLFYSIVGATGVGLTYWQLKRAKWKTNLVNDRKKIIFSSPIYFEEKLIQNNSLMSLINTPVVIKGRFDYAQEKLLGRETYLINKILTFFAFLNRFFTFF